MTNTELITAFTNAWSSQDMATVATYITNDIVFESPLAQLQGAEPYLEAVGQFAQLVSGLEIVTVVSEEERVIIIYDMHTKPFGTLRAAEYFIVRGGKVASDILVFDTYEVRKAQKASAPS